MTFWKCTVEQKAWFCNALASICTINHLRGKKRMIFPSSIKIIAEKIHQRIQLQNCAPIWNCNNHSWQNNQAEYQWLCCFPKTRFLLSKQGCFWSGICNSLFMHHLSNLIRGRWSICQKQFFHQVCQELASNTQSNSCKDTYLVG